jgi:hypothetical protein
MSGVPKEAWPASTALLFFPEHRTPNTDHLLSAIRAPPTILAGLDNGRETARPDR